VDLADYSRAFLRAAPFSDLVEGLRGISTSVLNERLNRLEDARLTIRRTLPPPAASKVYELTADGQELGRAIVPLAAWGVRILAANRRKRTETFRPAWGLLFLRATFDASSARDVHDVYEFHIDDSVVSVIVDDGEMQVIEGQSGRPVDVEIHVDATTFIDVGVGRLRGRDAIRQGRSSPLLEHHSAAGSAEIGWLTSRSSRRVDR
jgi:DNA-binding HxlR family transcriptional regulator